MKPYNRSEREMCAFYCPAPDNKAEKSSGEFNALGLFITLRLGLADVSDKLQAFTDILEKAFIVRK